MSSRFSNVRRTRVWTCVCGTGKGMALRSPRCTAASPSVGGMSFIVCRSPFASRERNGIGAR